MLSIIINTKNVAQTLERTLKSAQNLIKDLGGEIIVVDMKSDDNTLQIAETEGAKTFIFEEDYNFVEPARQFALSKASKEWILVLDADEELTLELQDKIKQIVSQQNPDSNKRPVEAYFIPRQNIIFEKTFVGTGWCPDYQLRLFRRGTVNWPSKLHADPEVDGEVEYLPADEEAHLAIIHHNYQNIDQYWQRALRYSSIQAEERKNSSNNPENSGLTQTEIFWQSFWSEYWRRLFANQGLNDGAHGLLLSTFQATSELIAVAKIWQDQGFPQNQLSPDDWQRIWRLWQKEFNYWRADYLVGQTDGLKSFYWQIRRKLKI